MNDQNCTMAESMGMIGSELRKFQADFVAQIVIELERRGIISNEGQETK